MKKKSILLDISLLKTHANFRRVFIARMISIVSLGMLTVAVPLQIHAMTGSTLQVGIVLALDGVGMFIGLLIGGVLADRFERRQLILTGRAACACGFSALAINCFIAEPSLLALYLLSVWSGFFGAIGITALMASIPLLVGRENIAAAGALGMLTVRIGTAISPAIGGIIIAASNLSWNYTAAALGTFMTLIPLRQLPSMSAQNTQSVHPLRSLAEGISFVFKHKIIGSVVALGLLDSLAKGIRVLFPALVVGFFGGGALELGLMYSAVPFGAMLGAFTSGWVTQLQRPGNVMLSCSIFAFVSLALFSLTNIFSAAIFLLSIYGYLGAISALLQYTIVQGHTPNHLLGRTNSLWTAQNVTGDSLGAFGLGGLSQLFSPLFSALSFSLTAGIAGMLMLVGFKSLRNTPIADENLPKMKPEIKNVTKATKKQETANASA